ncbi:MAG: phage head-tail adapter protein [Planctomycetes bacterium]|nr:phage head-tail adapter protein [Planctomycetota bacterium]MBL7152297.1 phage head-tail adapter protein [Phycisphaerae bacterium]
MHIDSSRFPKSCVFVGLAAVLACVLVASCGQSRRGYVPQSKCKALTTSKLLVELPDICPTPDGMATDREGNIVVACPNYGDQSRPAVLMKIGKGNKANLWVHVPTHPDTGVACPMGIDFGPDGDLFVCDNQGWVKPNDKGRILRLRIRNGKVVKTTVVADGMSHPNGIRVHEGKLYVTQSMLPKIKGPQVRFHRIDPNEHVSGGTASPSGGGIVLEQLVSAVYRFDIDDENVKVSNTRDDKNLLIEFKTLNMNCQYGLDGIVFDKQGNLYVGNFGDGTLHKITFDAQGNVASNTLYAKDKCMRTTDGICMDDAGNIYVADFSENAVCVVRPGGKVEVLARSPDCDGSKGGLDQPGEPIVRGNQLVVTCFDKVTGPDKVNTTHDKPYTIAYIDLPAK